MRRIADAQQPGAVPLPQAIDSDCQQLYLVPRGELGDPVREKGHDADNLRAKRLEPPPAQLVIAALRNHVRALPVVDAIQHDEDVAVADVAERRHPGIGGALRQAHPEDIDRRTDLFDG